MTQPQQNQFDPLSVYQNDWERQPLPPRDSRVHPVDQLPAGLLVHKCPECGRVMAKCAECESGKVKVKA